MVTSERTAREWFKEAERCYLENHQGCAWCGGAHRVFRQQQGTQHIYYCNACDFRVVRDQEGDKYSFFPGCSNPLTDQSTMFEI